MLSDQFIKRSKEIATRTDAHVRIALRRWIRVNEKELPDIEYRDYMDINVLGKFVDDAGGNSALLIEKARSEMVHRITEGN